jgi:hypothetical protein
MRRSRQRLFSWKSIFITLCAGGSATACGWLVDSTSGYAGSWCTAEAPLSAIFCDSFDDGPQSLDGGKAVGAVTFNNSWFVSPPTSLEFTSGADAAPSYFVLTPKTRGGVHCWFDVATQGVPPDSHFTAATFDLKSTGTDQVFCLARNSTGVGTLWVVSSDCATIPHVSASTELQESLTLAWHHVDLVLGPDDGGARWILTANLDDAATPAIAGGTAPISGLAEEILKVGLVQVDSASMASLSIDDLVCVIAP